MKGSRAAVFREKLRYQGERSMIYQLLDAWETNPPQGRQPFPPVSLPSFCPSHVGFLDWFRWMFCKQKNAQRENEKSKEKLERVSRWNADGPPVWHNSFQKQNNWFLLERALATTNHQGWRRRVSHPFPFPQQRWFALSRRITVSVIERHVRFNPHYIEIPAASFDMNVRVFEKKLAARCSKNREFDFIRGWKLSNHLIDSLHPVKSRGLFSPSDGSTTLWS